MIGEVSILDQKRRIFEALRQLPSSKRRAGSVNAEWPSEP
jgi:hypothetical protein